MYKSKKEMLEKQLELLSERSKECSTNRELVELTHAMVEIVDLISEFPA